MAHLRLLPIPFSVLVYDLPDLFAGKMSAILCRDWNNHVKGRDWYDLIWFAARNIPVHLKHLQTRLQQVGKINDSIELAPKNAMEILQNRIDTIDFEAAVADVSRFIVDSDSLQLWNADFFHNIADKIIWR